MHDPINPFPNIDSIQDCPILIVQFYVQTQSARGENQNRPSSSGGYGAAPGGRPGTASGFPDASMNPGMDPSDQDSAAYGYPSMVGHAHNTAGGESY